MAEFASSFLACFSSESVLSGTAAGTAAIIVGQPLDTVKVRSQIGQKVLDNYNVRSVLTLYRGFGAPLVTTGLVTAGQFGVFEACNTVAKASYFPDAKLLPLSVHFASGIAAGTMTSLVTCPTSIIKVQQQSQPKANETKFQRFTRKVTRIPLGVLSKAVKMKVVRASNVHKKYKKFKTRRAGAAKVASFGFTAKGYSNAKNGPRVSKLARKVYCAKAAGKIKSKVQAKAGPISLKECTQKMVRTQGVRGLYCGFGIHLYAEAVGKAVYMQVYELMKRQLDQDYGSGKTTKIDLSKRVLAGACGGVTCWATIYPADVIRSRMHAQAANASALSTVTVCKQLYAENGIRSFFRGFGATVLRAGPVAAVCLPTYDLMMRYLKSE